MRWPARFRDESGFTLVELVISTAIVGLLIGAIGSALFVVLRTTDVTNHRMAESHDVQITSAYLANDVQGAKTIDKDPSTTTCAVTGSMTTLVTFSIYDATDPTGNTTLPAVYKCGTAANGETRVTRAFAGGTPVVIAHFAGTSRPSVTVTYDLSHPTIPVSVTMTFTKASDCTLDCTYTLFGSRRSFSTSTAGGTGSPPAGVVLMSTGTSSPLWVQGSCPNGGTDPSTACYSDPLTIGLPTSDLSTTGWAPTPSSPTTLYDKLRDLSDVTGISTITQNRIAQFTLSPVTAPGGMNPTVEIRAASAGAAAKLKVHIYDSSTMQELVASGNINVNSSLDNSGDWTLSNLERSQIPDTAYQHLALGIEMTNNKSVTVYGLALNTSGPGLLTIKGPLLVNSPNVGAVTLTGSKNATKLSIINGGDFEIYKQGTCVGCDNKTVVCASCSWNGPTPPWTNYPNSIPDPLLSLPAPTLPQDQTCPGSVCQPGAYASFSRTSNTQLTPGIYYMKNGMSITGSASLTCPSCTGGQGVLLYIAGGSVTFAGSSSINLPASNSGLYKSILMFQAHGLTSPLKIAGNSGSGTTNVLGGIVYVPDSSQVTLATGSASLTAKAIVAQNIKVSSSVTIG
jgi:prepilin-type N-terminal cleavage/methylation domain-containing protein